MSDIVRVLNSVAASGADCVVDASGNIFLPGAPFAVKPSQIKSFSITPYLADTNAVWTGTPTAANLTSYQIRVGAMNTQTEQWMQFNSPVYVSDATATATEICDAMRTWINGLGLIPVTGTGTTTLILTGDTNYPYFTVTNVGTGVIAFVETTPAVVGTGLGSKITAVGEYKPPADQTQLVAANQYTTVQLELVPENWTGTGMKGAAVNYVLYVNQGDTDYVTLVGYDSTSGAAYGTLSAPVYNGKRAVYTTASANAAVADGVITIATDVFYGNTDTNIALAGGDFILVGLVDYRILSILTGATANTSSIPNDASSAATLYVKLISLPS